jgi:hypothetical protein
MPVQSLEQLDAVATLHLARALPGIIVITNILEELVLYFIVHNGIKYINLNTSSS